MWTRACLCVAALAMVSQARAADPCARTRPGDCNGDGRVTIDELLTGVTIALRGDAQDAACTAFNRDGSYDIEVSELIAAVNAALGIVPPTALAFIDEYRLASDAEPVALAVSPDGTHLYAAGAGTDGAIARYARDPASGTLTRLGVSPDESGGVAGLPFVGDLAVSPDGRHVYATNPFRDTLVVLRRDPASGALSLVQRLHDGDDGIDGLSFAERVGISPDGARVYVAARGDAALTVFARAPDTGRLTWLGVERDGVAGVCDWPLTLSVSPDSRFVYAAGRLDGRVAVLRVDDGETPLHLVAVQELTASRQFFDRLLRLFFTADGRHAYGVSRAHEVPIFARDAQTGLLSPAGTYRDDVGVYDLVAGPDPERLFANGVASTLTVLRRDPESGALAFASRTDPGPQVLGTAPLVSPDGTSLYGLRDNAIAAFRVDRVTDTVSFVATTAPVFAGSQHLEDVAGGVAISADGHTLYAGNRDTVAVFVRHPDTGRLRFIAAPRTLPDGHGPLNEIAAIALAPDGGDVYAADRDGRIAVFRVDPSTGRLTQTDTVTSGLTGFLELALSGDGVSVYVGSPTEHRLVVLRRTPASGALAPEQVLANGVDGVEGLGAVDGIAIDDGGRYVYVASSVDASVALFDRSTDSGRLSFRQRWPDPLAGSAPDTAMTDLRLTPDGRFLYSVGQVPSHVTEFARDPTTGALTPRGALTLGVDLVRAFSLLIHPDGTQLHVAGEGADTDRMVVSFARDPQRGTLTFIDTVEGSPLAAFSPDGRHAYGDGGESESLQAWRAED